MLSKQAQASKIAQVLTESLTSRPVRVALIVSAGMMALTAWIFSVSAAIAVILVLATAILFRGVRVGPTAAQSMLARARTVGALMLLGGLPLEWVLGSVVAQQLGAPSARQVWQRRYAEITTNAQPTVQPSTSPAAP